MQIKDYIKPTTIVRNVMRTHGKPTYMIFTNKYDTCRTVKCYAGDNSGELRKAVSEALQQAGVREFNIKTISTPTMRGGHFARSFIVRIPFSEQL
jgi:hypothetical protein